MDSACRRSIWMMVAVVVVLNSFDLFTTYLASPDLAREWNVLHRELNLGWAGLVGAKLLGGTLAVIGYWYYRMNRERCYPGPGLPPLEFCHHFLFGDDHNQQTRGLSDTVMRAAVTLGFLWSGMQAVLLWVAADNLLIYRGVSWRSGASQEWAYHAAQSVSVAFAVLGVMFYKNYRQYGALVHRHAMSVECAHTGTTQSA